MSSDVVLYLISSDSPSFMTNMGIWNDVVIVISKMTTIWNALVVMDPCCSSLQCSVFFLFFFSFFF